MIDYSELGRNVKLENLCLITGRTKSIDYLQDGIGTVQRGDLGPVAGGEHDPGEYPQMTQRGAEGRDPQTYSIIGAAMEVHGESGHGFLEAVYQEALAVEFGRRGIPFGKEIDLSVQYKGQPLRCLYKADFICYGQVLVETKALGRPTGIEEAQVINYLKATGLERALLINFGAERLEYKRLIFTHRRPSARLSADDADGADGDGLGQPGKSAAWGRSGGSDQLAAPTAPAPSTPPPPATHRTPSSPSAPSAPSADQEADQGAPDVSH